MDGRDRSRAAGVRQPLWTRVAVRVGQAAGRLSLRLGLGDGAVIGARVTLAVDRHALVRLAAGRQVVLVTGTNGKTTTAHLLAAGLRTLGPVAHNATSANMADGALAALAARPDAELAVLEVDELHRATSRGRSGRRLWCCSTSPGTSSTAALRSPPWPRRSARRWRSSPRRR